MKFLIRLGAGVLVAGFAVLTGMAADGAAGALPVDAAAAAAMAKGEAAVRKGLDWLKAQQAANGSWSDEQYPAMTAFGLWAFSRSDHPDRAAVCSNAVSFIAGFVQPDGGIYKPPSLILRQGGLTTYNTAVCMTALHAYDKAAYKDVILNARKFVASCQLEGDREDSGGFGYSKPGQGWSRGDLSNVGWALSAMRTTQDVEDQRQGEKRVDVNWDAALKFLGKLQDQDKSDPVNQGGFAYSPSGANAEKSVGKDGTVKLVGYGSMTYAGLLSLVYAGLDRNDPRVMSAVQWASRHWSVDENPGNGTKGLFYYYNVMARALSANGSDRIPREGAADIPWRLQLMNRLVASQSPEGSWVNANNRYWEGNAVLVTEYTVLALESALGR